MSQTHEEIQHPSKLSLCNHARALYTPTGVIVNGLFEANNYDGIKANEDWARMHNNERIGNVMNTAKYCSAGLGLFSAYSCARYASLSKSGKIWAPLGLGLSAYIFVSNMGAKAYYME